MSIGIGLIGCGSRLSNVIQLTLDGAEELEIRALCDPSEAAIAACRERCRCPDAVRHADYRALCGDPSVEWVCIGSWNVFHKDHIMAAMQAGKHVFSEKPLVTTMADCLAVKQAAERFEGIFSMGFVLRYAPFYRRVHELIAEGVLGDLISFEFNETLGHEHGAYIMSDWRRLREHAGTHLLEKCCHDIDLANWMTASLPVKAASFGGLNFFRPEHAHHMDRIGPNSEGIEAYKGWVKLGIYTTEHNLNPFMADKDIIDNQVAILQYANGVRATFHTNLNTAIPERRMYLCGTEGTIRGDVLTGEIQWKRIGHATELHTEQTAHGGHGGADGILADSLRNSMRTGAPPAVSWREGMHAAIACFGIDRALDTGTVVDLNPLWAQVGVTPDL